MIDSFAKATRSKGERICPKEIELLLSVHCERDIATFLDSHARPLHPGKVDRTGDIVSSPEEGKQKPREGSNLPSNTEHPTHSRTITSPPLPSFGPRSLCVLAQATRGLTGRERLG